MTAKERIVIVGNGMAGAKLAEELASRDRDRFDVTVIGDEPYGNHVGDMPAAVFHGRDGSWVAAHGVCPHKSGPLVDSIYGNGRLVCPLHSYSFDVATGACDNPDIRPVQIYEPVVRDGHLKVRVVRPHPPATKE